MSKKIFHPQDNCDVPLYTIPQVARYVGVPKTTLGDWVRGRKYKTTEGTVTVSKLIVPPQFNPASLSFNNLVEAHVLRSLRNKHELSMDKIRDAIDYAQKKLNVDRLLLREELVTDGQHIFLHKLSELINLSKSGQLAMETILKSHLSRIKYKDDMPYELWPFLPNNSDRRVVFINPNFSFGKPVTVTHKIPADILADRFDAGEELSALAKDYNIGQKEIEQAISYARAA